MSDEKCFFNKDARALIYTELYHISIWFDKKYSVESLDHLEMHWDG